MSSGEPAPRRCGVQSRAEAVRPAYSSGWFTVADDQSENQHDRSSQPEKET